MLCLRERPDNLVMTVAALKKKIADAIDPFYKTLDDGQKRRLTILTLIQDRFGGGWCRRGFLEHGIMDGDWDKNDGSGRGHRGSGQL